MKQPVDMEIRCFTIGQYEHVGGHILSIYLSSLLLLRWGLLVVFVDFCWFMNLYGKSVDFCWKISFFQGMKCSLLKNRLSFLKKNPPPILFVSLSLVVVVDAWNFSYFCSLIIYWKETLICFAHCRCLVIDFCWKIIWNFILIIEKNWYTF